FMGIARVAITATEFAAAVRIDGPLERQSGSGSVQNAPAADFEILDEALRFQNFALGGQLRDPDQTRWGRIAAQHNLIFAVYSPSVKGSFGLGNAPSQIRCSRLAEFLSPLWRVGIVHPDGRRRLLPFPANWLRSADRAAGCAEP